MKLPFYVEHTIDKPTNSTRIRQALVDTSEIGINNELEALLFRNHVRGKSSSSMLSIIYPSTANKGLKEGSWYEVSAGDLRDAEYVPVEENEPGGLFLRARLILRQTIDFTGTLTEPRTAIIPESDDLNLHPESDKMELSVVDCGQGNWNEISAKNDRVIYDVGASRQHTKSDIANLVASRALVEEKRNTHIIISHWDIDHYQALLMFGAEELHSVKTVLAPSQVPDTATYKRLKESLSEHGTTITSMSPSQNGPATGRRIALHKAASIGPYHFYRATPGRSRNQTGIVLCVHGEEKVAILTGDHHYEKIFSAIKGSYSGKHCIMVTPHHGGYAGELNVRDWKSQFCRFDTPISVGKNNPFEHPLKDNVDGLIHLQNGRKPSETRWLGTLNYQL